LALSSFSSSLRRRVWRTLCDLYLSAFLVKSDGEVKEKGEGRRDPS